MTQEPRYLDQSILRVLLSGPALQDAEGTLFDCVQDRVHKATVAVQAAQGVLDKSPLLQLILQSTGATRLRMEGDKCLLEGAPKSTTASKRKIAPSGSRPIDLLRAEAARLGIPTAGVSKKALRVAVEKAQAGAAKAPETPPSRVAPDPTPMPVPPPPPRAPRPAPATVVQMRPDQVSTAAEDPLSSILAGISREDEPEKEEDGVAVEYEDAPPPGRPPVRAPRLGTSLGTTSRKRPLPDLVASADDVDVDALTQETPPQPPSPF
jgi:hypothetical protein